EVYDPETDSWEPRAMLPTPRSGIGVVALNGRIHVLGGEEWAHNRAGVFRQHEAYDPKTNRWHLLPNMRFPRHGLAVGVVNEKIYAVSGANLAGGGDHKGKTYTEIYTLNGDRPFYGERGKELLKPSLSESLHFFPATWFHWHKNHAKRLNRFS
ncbi:MAG: Kelch repeat-containing protein, partial [Nitrospirales bacterium]